MTATTAAPARPSTDAAGPAGRLWGIYAWAETRRMMLHPATLTTLIAVLAFGVVPRVAEPLTLRYPYLTSSSWTIQYPLLLLAAGNFMAANLIASRDRRYGTSEFESVLCLPQGRRLTGMCAASLAPASAGFVIAAAQLMILAMQGGAAGSVRWAELATVPAFILFAGVTGTLVGTLLRTVATGFLVLAVLTIVSVAGLASASRLRWLGMVAGEDPFSLPPLPSDLIDRPAWWHMLWLTCLTVIVFLVLLLVAGSARKLALSGMVVVVTLAALSGFMQLRSVTSERTEKLRIATDEPSRLYVCEDHNSTQYCAFPEFRSRINAWSAIVDGQRDLIGSPTLSPRSIRQRVPLALGERGVAVPLPLDRWRPDDAASGASGAVPVSTRWSAGGVDSFDETEVLAFSAVVAAIHVTGREFTVDGYTLCGAQGVVALWLAAEATDDTLGSLSTVLQHTSGSFLDIPILNSATGVRIGPRELQLTQRILNLDPADVRLRVRSSWQTLTNGETGVDEAARILGVQTAPSTPASEVAVCRS